MGAIDGVLGAVVAISLAGLVFCWGLSERSHQVANDCKNFGKTEIREQWYECSPKDKKNE